MQDKRLKYFLFLGMGMLFLGYASPIQRTLSAATNIQDVSIEAIKKWGTKEADLGINPDLCEKDVISRATTILTCLVKVRASDTPKISVLKLDYANETLSGIALNFNIFQRDSSEKENSCHGLYIKSLENPADQSISFKSNSINDDIKTQYVYPSKNLNTGTAKVINYGPKGCMLYLYYHIKESVF